MTPKRTHSPSLTSNTPTKRQKKHHPTGATNRPGNVISPSLSQPEDTFTWTASHSGSPPQPVISLPSNDDETYDDDTRPYHAISMTAIQAQSPYGGSIQKPSSERPCPTGGRPTTHRAATAVDGKDSCKLDHSTPSLIWNMGLATYASLLLGCTPHNPLPAPPHRSHLQAQMTRKSILHPLYPFLGRTTWLR